jgi:hypothetical protein
MEVFVGGVRKSNKLVCGVGINDADYPTQRSNPRWVCPFYQTWTGMLRRAYYKNYSKKFKTYIDVSVCKSWHRFSNFKRWMETQDWQGKQLDKDLMIKGNKVYCAEACAFVTGRINNFLLEANAARGDYLLGVYLRKESGRFRSCTNWNDTTINLGTFVCEKEAHLAYCKKKLELAYKIIDEEKPEQRVADAIIKRYQDQLTEAEKLLSNKDFQEEI